MSVTVKNLIHLLASLPPETKIYTAGLEGIFEAELGNLFPVKVCETKQGIAVFIDDGVGLHGEISECWEPLNEFLYVDKRSRN